MRLARLMHGRYRDCTGFANRISVGKWISLRPRKKKAMNSYRKLMVLAAASLLTLPACEQPRNANEKDGLKDAFDTRPNEKLRDMGENMEKATKDFGSDVKNAVNPK